MVSLFTLYPWSTYDTDAFGPYSTISSVASSYQYLQQLFFGAKYTLLHPLGRTGCVSTHINRATTKVIIALFALSAARTTSNL